MRQFTRREFVTLVRQNGFGYVRSHGSHDIYYNKEGRHITIPQTLVDVIAKRLIKENNLVWKS